MTPTRVKWQTPHVVFQPQVYEGMKRGIKQVVQAIVPTLGPLPRLVVSQNTFGADHRPEILDDGATIARRIIQIRGRDEDMGAMFLRHVLWKLHETAGDGVATAVVMFDKIFEEGVKYIVAGGNAMRLRYFLDESCNLVLQELKRQVIPVHGKQMLTQLAKTISYDSELAKLLGEIFDIIGEYGRLEVRQGHGLNLEREYVEGMYWDGGLWSRSMIDDIKTGTAHLEAPAIFISDLSIREPEELLPVLETALNAGYKSILLVASEITERALAVLLIPANRQRIKVAAVKSPALDILGRAQALEDLAILSGGRPFYSAAGETTRGIQLNDLGQARRAWANQTAFGISGGGRNPRLIRQHINSLRSAYHDAGENGQHKTLRERIGKLMGGTAILWVGGTSPLQVEFRQALAERTAEALRSALCYGVVPGGGAALNACRKSLEAKMHRAADLDERAACRIACKALAAPMAAIMQNSGYNMDCWEEKIKRTGPEAGFDVIGKKVVRMPEAGIFDSAGVIEAAVTAAFHGAALGLSVDVLVHVANPVGKYQTP